VPRVETAETFGEAWGRQRPQHLADREVGGLAISDFPYEDVCSVGRQLLRLYTHARRDRVLLVLLEDLAARPEQVLATVCDFLGVGVHLPPGFAAHNAGRVNRSGLLARAWCGAYRALRHDRLYRVAKNALNGAGLRPGRWLFENVITREAAWQPPPAALLAAMAAAFRPDVKRLEVLTGRSLGHWLAGISACPRPADARNRFRADGAT
jgi:hypothetical protein